LPQLLEPISKADTDAEIIVGASLAQELISVIQVLWKFSLEFAIGGLPMRR
jgi:hypothetical protein